MAKKKEFVEGLTNILMKLGVVNQKEADAMKKDFYGRSKESFDFFLIDEGLVAKDKVLKALSIFYQVPSIDVVGLFFDHDLIRNFPKDFLLKNVVVPHEIDQEVLTVIANDPSDPSLLDKMEDFVTYTIEFQVGLKQDILDTIREFYDEPPEGYVHDIMDDDELENIEGELGEDVLDEMIDKKDRW